MKLIFIRISIERWSKSDLSAIQTDKQPLESIHTSKSLFLHLIDQSPLIHAERPTTTYGGWPSLLQSYIAVICICTWSVLLGVAEPIETYECSLQFELEFGPTSSQGSEYPMADRDSFICVFLHSRSVIRSQAFAVSPNACLAVFRCPMAATNWWSSSDQYACVPRMRR